MKYAFLLISLFFFNRELVLGQNKHISIGVRGNGFALGNPKKYNGLKLNLWDKNIDRFNGIHISSYTNADISNGLKIGFLICQDSISNGICIGGLAIEGSKINGLAIAGIVAGPDYFNGLAISPVISSNKKFNGLALTLIGIYSGQLNGICFSMYFNKRIREEENFTVNGFAFGIVGGADCHKLNGLSIGLGNVIDTLNGISVGAINKTNELHGIQFGLWNIAKNNKHFKRLPLMNINLKSKRKDTE